MPNFLDYSVFTEFGLAAQADSPKEAGKEADRLMKSGRLDLGIAGSNHITLVGIKYKDLCVIDLWVRDHYRHKFVKVFTLQDW